MKKCKFISFVSIIFALSLIFASCSSGSDSEKNSGSISSNENYGYNMDASNFGDESNSSDSINNSESSEITSSEKIIRNANIEAQTTEFDNFNSSLKAEIISAGGYIANSRVGGKGYYGSSHRNAEYEIRIPSDKLDEFMSKVSDMAYIISSGVSTENVTMQYVDTESHLKALKTERDSLLSLMEKAENLNDVILLQERITNVIYEIESAERQLRTYDDLIQYSTVQLSVYEVEREATDNNASVWSQISNNLKNNLSNIGDGFTSFFVWFVSALPYFGVVLVILGIPAVIVIVSVKCSVKRRKKRVHSDSDSES